MGKDQEPTVSFFLGVDLESILQKISKAKARNERGVNVTGADALTVLRAAAESGWQIGVRKGEGIGPAVGPLKDMEIALIKPEENKS